MKDSKELFSKACVSATAGLPISVGLNFLILPFFIHQIAENYILGTLITSAPYFVASVLRLYYFDYFYEKYNIRLDPSYYIKKYLFKQN